MMQEGDWRTLYDGPVTAGKLRELKPHANCHGRGCDKIAMREEADSEWRIVRGKPYCGDCSAKRRGGKKSAPEREAWLHESEVAKELVARGLNQAAAGQFSESPPDLDTGGTPNEELVIPDRYDDLVRMMPPRAIADDDHNEKVLKVIDRLMASSKGLSDDQVAYLETLVQLVEVYEAKTPQYPEKG